MERKPEEASKASDKPKDDPPPSSQGDSVKTAKESGTGTQVDIRA
ncbi:MAG: hypothetical protein Q8M76_11385 [Spirochaetaceae bacterium]|nr:hypothetical protein [Spirochaetaceae bacterium]